MLAMSVEEINKPQYRYSDIDSILISINPDTNNQETIDTIKKILNTYPGENPVLLELTNGNGATKLKLGKDYRVEAKNKLISELKELHGASSVNII